MSVAAARPLLLAGALALAGAIPAVAGEVYYRTAPYAGSSPARIVSLLQGGEGYVYSMYPGFALWSGRELYPWYYAVDSMLPRLIGRVGDADLLGVFSECDALVLVPDELATYPRARAYVERHFRLAHEDAYFALWVRSAGAG